MSGFMAEHVEGLLERLRAAELERDALRVEVERLRAAYADVSRIAAEGEEKR